MLDALCVAGRSETTVRSTHRRRPTPNVGLDTRAQSESYDVDFYGVTAPRNPRLCALEEASPAHAIQSAVLG